MAKIKNSDVTRRIKATQHKIRRTTVWVPILLGVMIGIGALFTRVVMLEFQAGNIVLGMLLVSFTVAAMMSGLITQQGGFQRGRAMTITAFLAVLNKVIAIFGGMFALGEVLPENAEKQLLRLTGLGALLVGVVLLARFSKQEGA